MVMLFPNLEEAAEEKNLPRVARWKQFYHCVPDHDHGVDGDDLGGTGNDEDDDDDDDDGHDNDDSDGDGHDHSHDDDAGDNDDDDDNDGHDHNDGYGHGHGHSHDDGNGDGDGGGEQSPDSERKPSNNGAGETDKHLTIVWLRHLFSSVGTRILQHVYLRMT